jgi:hypothetical protein
MAGTIVFKAVGFNHRGADVDDETCLRPGVPKYLVAENIPRLIF